tara:strand:+ start:4957 stop:5634 length:678 start_codon:yes stop_codon:yes gene_type:complete
MANNYLLIGNSRLHWAKNLQKNNYQFIHTTKNEKHPKKINYESLIWASVGNYPIEKFKKENEVKKKDLNIKNFPSHFGIDRVFGCIAALKKVNNPLKKNLLIADLGTTLSITKINYEGELIGGHLIPGFNTQLKSLEESTRNLSQPHSYKIPIKEFPILTKDAMLRGVYNSLLGAITLAFNEKNDILIICGGDANLLGKKINTVFNNVNLEPNLVMMGMIISQET